MVPIINLNPATYFPYAVNYSGKKTSAKRQIRIWCNKKKTGGNSNELVIYVYDLVDAWKSIIVTTRQRFWFLDFWNALLCVLPHRNQKRCHVFKIDESFGGNVAVNETLREWHSKERREAWVPVLRCMLVTEELLEGDSHPRLVSSCHVMPCYIAWHIVLLAEFQYVVKLWQLWELKTWHHGSMFIHS